MSQMTSWMILSMPVTYHVFVFAEMFVCVEHFRKQHGLH